MSSSEVAAWEDFWELYYEDHHQSQLVDQVLDEYPTKRGLPIDYQALISNGIEPGKIRTQPDTVFQNGRESLAEFVSEFDSGDHVDFEMVEFHLVSLPPEEGGEASSGFTQHMLELVQERDAVLNDISDVQMQVVKATYCCPNGHRTTISNRDLQKRSISVCPHEGCTAGVYFEPNESSYAPLCRLEVSGPGFEIEGVTNGRNISRVEGLEPGDDILFTAIPRANVTADSTIAETYLDILYLEGTAHDEF
jgi:hypothetical protein